MFHAVQSTYGWEDDYVLDLRISRLVQIMAVIQASRETDDEVRRSELTWQTRMLASVMVATSQLDDGSKKKLGGQIDQIDLNVASGGGLSSADTTGDTRTLEEVIEYGSVAQALERNNRRKGPGLPFS